MEIYKILESIMLEQNLSIPDIARLSGLSDSTVRGIITRKQKSIALEVAFKLSSGLNVSLEQLNGMEYSNRYIENDGNVENDTKNLSTEELNHIKKYRSLNENGKSKVDDYMKFVLSDTGNILSNPTSTHIPDIEKITQEALEFKKAMCKAQLKK